MRIHQFILGLNIGIISFAGHASIESDLNQHLNSPLPSVKRLEIAMSTEDSQLTAAINLLTQYQTELSKFNCSSLKEAYDRNFASASSLAGPISGAESAVSVSKNDLNKINAINDNYVSNPGNYIVSAAGFYYQGYYSYPKQAVINAIQAAIDEAQGRLTTFSQQKAGFESAATQFKVALGSCESSRAEAQRLVNEQSAKVERARSAAKAAADAKAAANTEAVAKTNTITNSKATVVNDVSISTKTSQALANYKRKLAICNSSKMRLNSAINALNNTKTAHAAATGARKKTLKNQIQERQATLSRLRSTRNQNCNSSMLSQAKSDYNSLVSQHISLCKRDFPTDPAAAGGISKAARNRSLLNQCVIRFKKI